jgi:hypothetical protein
MLTPNLLLQIDVLTHESVTQIAHFFVRQAVVQGNRHRAPHLIEQYRVEAHGRLPLLPP